MSDELETLENRLRRQSLLRCYRRCRRPRRPHRRYRHRPNPKLNSACVLPRHRPRPSHRPSPRPQPRRRSTQKETAAPLSPALPAVSCPAAQVAPVRDGGREEQCEQVAGREAPDRRLGAGHELAEHLLQRHPFVNEIWHLMKCGRANRTDMFQLRDFGRGFDHAQPLDQSGNIGNLKPR